MVNARQYLSKTDESWAERLTFLADAMEDSGAPTPTGADIGNKYTMAADSSRHSDTKDRFVEKEYWMRRGLSSLSQWNPSRKLS